VIAFIGFLTLLRRIGAGRASYSAVVIPDSDGSRGTGRGISNGLCLLRHAGALLGVSFA
jgi:hypothetical protein